MIRLHYSNRMEALLSALSAAVRQERAVDGGWRTIRMVVPNLATARRIELHLVQDLGLAANLKLEFLDGFLRGFLPEGQNLIDRPAIEGILLRRFQSGEGLEEPALAPIQRYLGTPAEPRRIAQLAYRLGGLLEEYLYSRPEWAAAWEAGRAVLQDAGLEPCERALWRLVRAELQGTGQDWITPREAVGKLQVPADLGPVHLVGMTHLAFGYALLLDRVGKLAPGCLEFLALNPCQEFWDDLPHAKDADRTVARMALRLGLEALSDPGGAPEDEDPYGLQRNLPEEADLLRRWGRPGREKLRLLNELSDKYEFGWYVVSNVGNNKVDGWIIIRKS